MFYLNLPRITYVATATKFETQSAITRIVSEISPRSLRLTGGFRGQAIEWRQSNFTTTDHVAMARKCEMGYNSACIENIAKMPAFIGGFRDLSTEWYQTNSTTTDPRCHGNKIWAKIGYNSACIWDISAKIIWTHHIVQTISFKLISFFYISIIIGRAALS